MGFQKGPQTLLFCCAISATKATSSRRLDTALRSRQRHRPRKEISRGNLLCAASGLPSLSYPRLAVAQKYVTTPDWENLCTGQPQGARGTAVPLFREESRGTPSKGFLWATSSRRLDTALLCAAKKRGVEKNQLAGLCQNQTGACRHARQQKVPRRASTFCARAWICPRSALWQSWMPTRKASCAVRPA